VQIGTTKILQGEGQSEDSYDRMSYYMNNLHTETILKSQGLEATRTLGEILGRQVAPSTLIVLSGELGAGKTELAAAIGKGMGIECAMTSPTFSILKCYESGRIPLSHLDVYRLEDVTQLVDIGFWDLLSPGEPSAVLVEWGEKFSEIVGSADLVVVITAKDSDARDIKLRSHSEKGDELLAAALPSVG